MKLIAIKTENGSNISRDSFRVYKLFKNEIYIKYRDFKDNCTTEYELAIKNDRIFYTLSNVNENIKMIKIGEKAYILNDKKKKYTIVSLNKYSNEESIIDIKIDDNTQISSRTTEYKGKIYDYEEYYAKTGKIRCCFEKNTDILKYMMAIGECFEVVDYSLKVSDSLFTIPKDYSKRDFSFLTKLFG